MKKDSFKFASQYGTYNIQKTSDTDNEFPAISQGNPKLKNKKKK